MEDIVIIGAGIVGSFLAYDLSHYHCKVTIIDKENDVANQTTMANSAIIHAGYDPQEGTLKAKLNVRGAALYPEICKRIEADYRKTGAFILVSEPEQLQQLHQLYDRAVRRHIRAEIVQREELIRQEPNLSDRVVAGLSVPDTAVVTPWQIAIHLVRDAISNGVQLHLGCEVQKIQAEKDHFTVHCSDRTIRTRWIINAAGNGAQQIAEMVEESPFVLHHYRGQYFVLSKNCKDFVHHICYPVPTKAGKGVLAVPTVHGNILLGPTREECLDSDTSTTAAGLEEVQRKLDQIVKNVPMDQVIRVYSGIRATGEHKDFYIEASKKYPHMIHAACIDSPGLASAPAISEYILERWFKDLKKKDDYVHIPSPLVMAQCPPSLCQQKIRENPLYGKIVCKCEKISYQEIVDAIHIPLGASSIKGIKKRVRPGMGRCQGGFCQGEIALILSKELGIPVEKVLYDETESALGWEAK